MVKIMTFLNHRFSEFKYILISAFCLLIGATDATALNASFYASESKLAKGNWVKIKVEDSGIYAISESDARNWGFSDLSQLKVFGYGGAPISTLLNDSQIDDLPQVPTYRTNGKILFYAQGAITWDYSPSRQIPFIQIQHPYSTSGYYLISDREDIEPLQFESVSTAIATTDNVTSTFTDRLFHEEELYSPGETGNFLLGEDFRYKSSQTFKFTMPGYASGSNVFVQTAFAAKVIGGSSSKLSFSYNGTALTSSMDDYVKAISSSDSYTHCALASPIKQFSLSGNAFDWTVAFSYSGNLLSMARLNYITVNYTRNLNITDADFAFRNYGSATNTVLSISGAKSSTVILDVTNAGKPFIVTTTASGNDVRFSPSASGLREYRAFDASGSFPAPVKVGNIANQDIHGDSIPDMIIITPAEFSAQAERVAQLHKDIDSMRVTILTPDVIYNEFSSGTPDVMAYRKLAKMFFDRGTDSKGHHLQHLLLFGRSSYDNRQLTADVKSNSYPRLLQWENNVGDYDNSSFTTDDILGTLADGSSENNMSDPRYGGMVIGVGRMPVKSVAEAKTVVDKLYSYVTGGDYGSWKNNVVMIADDGDNGIHMRQSDEAISHMRNADGNAYQFGRIFLDAFKQISDGSGNYYPEARKKMFQKLDEGAIMVHYIGHANPKSWTHDGLLNITDINNMYLKHYPLFYTATCEFSRFDANETSGGEILFLNGRGGAIALFSTTRPTYISDNAIISNAFGDYLFKRDENNNHLRLGDIVRLTKNNAIYNNSTTTTYANTNKLRFTLIGDPAMRLAYPSYSITLDEINGKKIDAENMPEFKARQSLTVKGSIYDNKGLKATDFNGTITPTLYDAEQSIETKGNAAHNEDTGPIDKYVYQERINRLAITKDSVRNGEFTVKINIPSEIQNPTSFDNYSSALLSFYANSDKGIDANGTNDNFYIYGYDDDVKADTIGPDISQFVLNTESFNSGDDVNESPMVIASVSSSSGINFSTSGIGHQMTLLLDNTTLYSDVSTYYTPLISDGSTVGGKINYPLEDLSAGNHTLRLKVWDNFSNSSEKTIEFNVIKGLKPQLYEVYTTASPAHTEANFYLTHDRPDATITVRLSIYNLMGQEVWTSTQTGKSDMFKSFPITWDLTDATGRRVQRGIYIYRASISTDGVQESTKSKRIAVAAE